MLRENLDKSRLNTDESIESTSEFFRVKGFPKLHVTLNVNDRDGWEFVIDLRFVTNIAPRIAE